MISSIHQKWRKLSGEEDWNGLLDPLDIDLRRYLIHYGERTQATYDTFNSEPASRYVGSSRYAKKNLFARVGLEIANPYKYNVTKYLYATSQIGVPETFLLKPKMGDPWLKESNWMGYIAVATDEGKVALGRRDILIAWRGTITAAEWLKDFEFPLTSAAKIFGNENNPLVSEGFLSLYTSENARWKVSRISAKDQVTLELKRLLDKYQSEELSITVTGHSLGAALAILNAGDIVAQGLNKRNKKNLHVTAFVFAAPRVGDPNLKKVLQSMDHLHVLQVSNVPDIVPHLPPVGLFGYSENVGKVLTINTTESYFLRYPGDIASWHKLEPYLHGIAGTQGSKGGFRLEVKRDISLVNKDLSILKINQYSVPIAWWVEKNKGMVQQMDGSWILDDHEEDDDDFA